MKMKTYNHNPSDINDLLHGYGPTVSKERFDVSEKWWRPNIPVVDISCYPPRYVADNLVYIHTKEGVFASKYIHMRGSQYILDGGKYYHDAVKYHYPLYICYRYLNVLNKKINNLQSKNKLDYLYLGFKDNGGAAYNTYIHSMAVEVAEIISSKIHIKHDLHPNSTRQIFNSLKCNIEEALKGREYISDGEFALLPCSLKGKSLHVIGGHYYLTNENHQIDAVIHNLMNCSRDIESKP